MLKNNITLIGMPGSGKSYIGKKLAEKLGYEIIDLDSIMEEKFNLPLQKILDNLGQDLFLKKQADDVLKHTENKTRLVISPGGSIVYSPDAMEHLKNISTIVYLKTSLDTIKLRINENTRGIVGIGEKTIEELYDERIKLYEKYSEIIVDAEQEVEKIIEDIINF